MTVRPKVGDRSGGPIKSRTSGALGGGISSRWGRRMVDVDGEVRPRPSVWCKERVDCVQIGVGVGKVVVRIHVRQYCGLVGNTVRGGRRQIRRWISAKKGSGFPGFNTCTKLAIKPTRRGDYGCTPAYYAHSVVQSGRFGFDS